MSLREFGPDGSGEARSLGPDGLEPGAQPKNQAGVGPRFDGEVTKRRAAKAFRRKPRGDSVRLPGAEIQDQVQTRPVDVGGVDQAFQALEQCRTALRIGLAPATEMPGKMPLPDELP